MKLSKLDSKTLDAIGKELIGRRTKTGQVIDRIASKPDLFARIQTNIASGPSVSKPNLRLYAATFATVLITSIAAIGIVGLLGSNQKESVAINVVDPVSQPVQARPDLPPPVVGAEDRPSAGRAFDRPARAERPMVQNASYTPRRIKESRPSAAPPDDEFYAISYGGDQAETTGGHIVRVDMPRSSLFALGVNVPLENDSPTVKADLLIGPDGVTRAIRVVK